MSDLFSKGMGIPAPSAGAYSPAVFSTGGDIPATYRCVQAPGTRPARIPLVIPVLIAVIVLVLSGVPVNDAVTAVLAAGAAADQLKRSA